ncbi:MAG: NADPH-dependent fmn reductase [Pseudonocardiales bacterium]|jgi:FMN reductase|nr:NADPH-dependent fmn reductase [Pseudonocardiales bacterium]
MSTTIIVGNPKPQSRTFEAANLVAQRLTGGAPDLSLDLTTFGAALLDWSDEGVKDAIAAVQNSDLIIVASPTYKATYTGLLKLFLDRISGGALAGVTAVPLMLGGHWRHSLAADLLLKPVLVELGATCPTRGLFLLDSDYSESDELTQWLDQAGPQIKRNLS